MSGGWGLGGVLGAGLALIALEAITSNPGGGANGGVPGLFSLPGQWAAGWMDPTKPLIGGAAGAVGGVANTTAGFGAAGIFGPISTAVTPPATAGGGKKKR